MTEVHYSGDWPTDIKAIVESVLRPWVHLVPGWCRTIDVRFESEDGEDCASVRVNFEARWAVISIHPQWLEEDPEDRERILVHEIVHIHIHPMRSAFHDSIESLDKPLKDFAWTRFKEAWEGATEDLAWGFTPAEK